MATEYKLSYTASEINRKLATVDETKNSLENDYYTSADIDIKFGEVDDSIEKTSADIENINTSIEEMNSLIEETNISIESALTTKANLVDGKVPAEQLPEITHSWSDVEDKPFYDTRVVSHYSYDENPDPVSFDCEPISYSFYKVSDFVLTKEEVFNTKITINDRAIEQFSQSNVLVETDELVIAQESATDGYAFAFCNTVGTCPFTFAGYPLSVDVPETGIYRVFYIGLGMSDCQSVKINAGGELKQIDPKFIPADLDFNIDLSDYYTKSETYTQSEIDDKIANIDVNVDVDLGDYYTKSQTYNKTETDNQITAKMDAGLSNYYNKSEVDDKIADIDIDVDLSNYYTKSEVDNQISLSISQIDTALSSLVGNGVLE